MQSLNKGGLPWRSRCAVREVIGARGEPLLPEEYTDMQEYDSVLPLHPRREVVALLCFPQVRSIVPTDFYLNDLEELRCPAFRSGS
jgi:hypothetical protein